MDWFTSYPISSRPHRPCPVDHRYGFLRTTDCSLPDGESGRCLGCVLWRRLSTSQCSVGGKAVSPAKYFFCSLWPSSRRGSLRASWCCGGFSLRCAAQPVSVAGRAERGAVLSNCQSDEDRVLQKCPMWWRETANKRFPLDYMNIQRPTKGCFSGY